MNNSKYLKDQRYFKITTFKLKENLYIFTDTYSAPKAAVKPDCLSYAFTDTSNMSCTHIQFTKGVLRFKNSYAHYCLYIFVLLNK